MGCACRTMLMRELPGLLQRRQHVRLCGGPERANECGRRTAMNPPKDAGTPPVQFNQRLALLLAMAMFVLVVDTSIMNVSISAVVDDIGATVSGLQSTIALEALVSAAFILIGGQIGRKRAYVIGLSCYAVGAVAMTLAQTLLPVIICWALIGGLGASLL